MSEYTEVEQPFLQQLAQQGWQIIDQGQGIPQDPSISLRGNFREWLLPEVFNQAVSGLNKTTMGQQGLSTNQLLDHYTSRVQSKPRSLEREYLIDYPLLRV